MRLGVLDIGSNTVHLLVVDVHRGAHPWPAHSEKSFLGLAEELRPGGVISDRSAGALEVAVSRAMRSARELEVDELVGFATSAVREASNGAEVLDQVRHATGLELRVFTGEEEARTTFLAVRRWFGWSGGRLLVLDIGGGSLEIAVGIDEEPELTLSLPLGAGRLTRDHLAGPDPPPDAAVADLTGHVATVLQPAVRTLAQRRWDRVVATSKTFRSLARLAGAAPAGAGQWVPRRLTATDLHQVLEFIRRIPAGALATMEGVSGDRAHQLLAGGVVAEELLRRLHIDTVDLCPWALREGVILRRLDLTPASPD